METLRQLENRSHRKKAPPPPPRPSPSPGRGPDLSLQLQAFDFGRVHFLSLCLSPLYKQTIGLVLSNCDTPGLAGLCSRWEWRYLPRPCCAPRELGWPYGQRACQAERSPDLGASEARGGCAPLNEQRARTRLSHCSCRLHALRVPMHPGAGQAGAATGLGTGNRCVAATRRGARCQTPQSRQGQSVAGKLAGEPGSPWEEVEPRHVLEGERSREAFVPGDNNRSFCK